uniref:G-patch domain-containing protein n=1 Tax=Syphacia muris TaxID=451379 RepID=A0A0N5A8B8_9BILA
MSELTFYGTELEELSDEEAGVSRKPLSIQEQCVKDERGRRRFHGAFTGGFSAGYFNTVGSKEGWQPATFRSSRDSRNEFVASKPEDFMDEEDLGEFGIAERVIRVSAEGKYGTKKFAWENNIKANLAENLSSVLEAVIRPMSDSVGVRLLKKMGWREGQGIGPKRTKKVAEKMRKNEHRLYGIKTKLDEEDICESERMAPGFLFSPQDIESFALRSHEGTHGLGYEGLKKSDILSENYGVLEAAMKIKAKSKGIRGQAFGVGAFEDDDVNIYTDYDLTQYDYSIGNDDSAPLLPQTDTFVVSSQRYCRRCFPDPPRVPPNFRPIHKPIFFDIHIMPDSIKKFGDNMTQFQRAKYLGEVDKNSIMELIRDEDRKKLKSRWDVPKVDKVDIDENSFEDEPMKQARFRQYVAYLKRGLNLSQPVEMTSLEWERELREFNAKLPANLRALLPEVKSRQQPLAPLELSLPIAEVLKKKFVTSSKGEGKKKEIEDEDLISAVKMKVFGEITRQTHEWHPCKVLLKRFNVPDPYPSSTLVGVPHLQKTKKSENLMNLGSTAEELRYKQAKQEQQQPQPNEEIKNAEVSIISDSDKNESNGKNSDYAVEDKVPEGLLKAIFEDNDNESVSSYSSSSHGDDNEESKQVIQKTIPSCSCKQENFVNIMDIMPGDDEEFGPALPPTLLEQSTHSK